MNKEFSELETDLIKLSRVRQRDKDLENISMKYGDQNEKNNTYLMGILQGKGNTTIVKR